MFHSWGKRMSKSCTVQELAYSSNVNKISVLAELKLES